MSILIVMLVNAIKVSNRHSSSQILLSHLPLKLSFMMSRLHQCLWMTLNTMLSSSIISQSMYGSTRSKENLKSMMSLSGSNP